MSFGAGCRFSLQRSLHTSQAAKQISIQRLTLQASRRLKTPSIRHPHCTFSTFPVRQFHVATQRRIDVISGSSQSQPAHQLSHDVTEEESEHFTKVLAEDKGKQIRSPWHRDGSDRPPVATRREASAMTKGKLLTTPSRMLKLVLPLTTLDFNSDRKDVEPLALLVHPQQPLSYLERLIQSELPMIKDKDGKERIPNVYFRAEDSVKHDAESDEVETPDKAEEEAKEDDKSGKDDDIDRPDETVIEGKSAKTGKINLKTQEVEDDLRGGPGEGGVESYSGLGHEAEAASDSERKFVRWSSSTEIGDFIRDAARGKEFAIEIEGAPNDVRVGVPSFHDRTYYLRMRLRKKAREISRMADIKKECDHLAERGAKRVAFAGGAILVGWWAVVYQLTFRTDLGWDVMEPVTYLVGLSTLIGGYIWFLVHNRQVSYRSAMNFTISKRQSKLYEQRGFDLRRWEDLIEEGNKLRQEIKGVAAEYDVDWDETQDETSEKVRQALKKEREKKKKGKEEKKDEGDDEDDD